MGEANEWRRVLLIRQQLLDIIVDSEVVLRAVLDMILREKFGLVRFDDFERDGIRRCHGARARHSKKK